MSFSNLEVFLAAGKSKNMVVTVELDSNESILFALTWFKKASKFA